MKKLNKWLAMLLVIVMCVSILAGCKPPVTDPGESTGESTPVEIQGYTQSPYIADTMGITSDVTERLPVKEDIMIENAGYLEVGVFGGTLKRAADSGNWYAGKPKRSKLMWSVPLVLRKVRVLKPNDSIGFFHASKKGTAKSFSSK
jgi:hypothetical protein